MAEREGFEPSIRFLLYALSRGAPSATRPPLQNRVHNNIGLGETRRADLVSDWHVARLRNGKFCVDCATEKLADSVQMALSLSPGN